VRVIPHTKSRPESCFITRAAFVQCDVDNYLDLTSAFRFEVEKSQAPKLPDAIHALSRARYEASYLPTPVLPGEEQKPPMQLPPNLKHGDLPPLPHGRHLAHTVRDASPRARMRWAEIWHMAME
jgi:hypothetical protein